MVCEWGMSERLGPVRYGKHEEMVFLGREISQQRDFSESTAILIDQEVRRLMEAGRDTAVKLLSANIDKLHLLATTLLDREVLDGEEITTLFSGGTLAPLRKINPAETPGEGGEDATATSGEAEGDTASSDEPAAEASANAAADLSAPMTLQMTPAAIATTAPGLATTHVPPTAS